VLFAVAMMLAVDSQAAQASQIQRTVIVGIAQEYVAARATPFAKDQAGKMFAKIGVRIEWRTVGHPALPAEAITVDMLKDGSVNECAGALGCAKPYAGHQVRVFYDRLLTAAPEPMVPILLAHVLVHEITHILQRASRHSQSGVMKGRWDGKDFAQMRFQTLAFTQQDVLLIERGLAAREAKPAGFVASSVDSPTRSSPELRTTSSASSSFSYLANEPEQSR
jgi:hypothetical protein